MKYILAMYCLHNRYIQTFALSLIFVGVLSFSRTQAATTTLNATINPGNLTLSNSSVATISAVTLEGVSQASTGSLGPITVIDNRGTGAGWSVTATVSDFACCQPSKIIPVTNLKVDPGLLAVVSGKSSGVFSGDARNILSPTDSLTLMTAVSDGGLGSYQIKPSISLSIPGDAYAGTYTATVTITII